MKKNKASSYVISVGEFDEAESVVGTMRSNHHRTEFTLCNDGRNPAGSHGALLEESHTQELMAVSYESILGFIKLQQMSAIIPHMDRNSQRVCLGDGSLLKKMKNNQGAGLIKLETIVPAWNEEKQEYVMDFNGRVKKGSVKNFQLACSDSPDKLVMQFGRVDENRFVLDYSSPLCALQAFTIALSCFDE
ncbi:tubby-related protein 3-like [Colossoma macropomum]|uniref:tubby-related protein 3-like n=1 Tax=Colossoma macropomum TaxID=42526 RepID=UPI001864FAD8|nr:tubby-related protein 3-like [Colossoma macropomum]